MATNPEVFDFDIGDVTGKKGDTGNGIKSIELLSTSGLNKTYRITMTDDTTFDFSVSDGEDGNGISGASFDPQTNALTITFDDGSTFTTPSLKGVQGDPGDDGYSPAVTIAPITGGHRVTITDEEHPAGQSFDVLDGTNDAGNVSYDETATYQSGTVGAELQDLGSGKQDAPATAGTAGQVLGLDSNLNPAWMDQTGGSSEDAAPIIINTASGNIASFADGADNRQIRKIVGTIVPVQEGSGDPSPDNVRPISGWTGAIIYQLGLPGGYTPVESVTVNNAVVIPTEINFNSNDIEVVCCFKPLVYNQYRAVYTVYTSETANATRLIYNTGIGTFLVNNNTRASAPTSIIITSTTDWTTTISTHNTIYVNGTGSAMVLNAGTANTSKKFQVGGNGASTAIRAVLVRKSVALGGDYLLCLVPCVNDKGIAGFFDTVGNQFYTTASTSDISASGKYSNIDYLYNATLPINWQSEAGTIYGGTVTLNEDGSADVVATWAGKEFDGVNNKVSIPSASWIGTVVTRAYKNAFSTNAKSPANATSESAPYSTSGTDVQRFYIVASIGETNIFILNSLTGITSEDTAASAATKMNAYLAEHPFKFIYELATPESTIHLDNIGQLYTFLGTNNVWIDTGSITECDYPADTKTYVDGKGGDVTDVQINGTSVLSDGVANIPKATASVLGAVRGNEDAGVRVADNGSLATSPATTNHVKLGSNTYKPLVPVVQHIAAFYGLAKAAGDTTQSASSNPVGTYTDEAKTAINTMLGSVQAPANPTSGAFLVWDGSAWVAQTLATWQGGSF